MLTVFNGKNIDEKPLSDEAYQHKGDMPTFPAPSFRITPAIGIRRCVPDNSTVAHADQQMPTYCVTTVVTVNKGPLFSGAPTNRPSLHKNTRPRAIYLGSQIKLVATAYSS